VASFRLPLEEQLKLCLLVVLQDQPVDHRPDLDLLVTVFDHFVAPDLLLGLDLPSVHADHEV
jgi:hypothetical protein